MGDSFWYDVDVMVGEALYQKDLVLEILSEKILSRLEY